MSRALVIFLIIVVILAGALWYLSSQASEVPTRPVEVDVTNEVAS